MAPGCFSHSSSEASSVNNTRESSGVVMDTKSDYIEISSLSPSIEHLDIESASSMSKNTQNASLIENTAFDCYAGEINLDQIPLPLTPFPGQEEDLEDDEDEKRSNEGKTDLLLIKKMPRLISSVRSPNFSSIDTVDTFEILEQTIIKQKRLAKLKNTDLRRKVLLKRTFDLVLEIMDAENGFNDDEVDSTSTPTVESEPTRNVDTELSQTLELELHPSTCMEDDENEIEKKEAEKTTLVKLVECEFSSARVPRQVKRRSSGSDEDDEDDEYESDDEDEETYYSLLNHDQQINYRDAKTTRNDELNIYIDSVEISRVEKTERRSNHQRKRVKLTI